MNVKVEVAKEAELELRTGDVITWDDMTYILIKGDSDKYVLKNVGNGWSRLGTRFSGIPEVKKYLERQFDDGEISHYPASQYELVLRKKQ